MQILLKFSKFAKIYAKSPLLMSKASKDKFNSISTIHLGDEYFCGQPKGMCPGGRKLSR